MTHTITLVTDTYLSKTEALEALSEALGVRVDSAEASNSVLRLVNGVVLSIEVPKFGEDLPLTVDLTGDTAAEVTEVAQNLMALVVEKLAWSIGVVGSP